jgi:SAM-dependent MidA family methyltransferase
MTQTFTPPAARRELLQQHVQRRIAKEGPITFAEYMREALYHPGLGYYATPESRIGQRGDYFTSVSATPLFGRLLAHHLDAWRQQLDTSPFAVYEFGANQGHLKSDIVSVLGDLEYYALDFRDPVPDSLCGCVLSNELLDAMPFHRLKVVAGKWRELYVGIGAAATPFQWELGALSNTDLEQRVAALPVELMEGYETEVSLAACEWLELVGSRLRAGIVVSFDYGHDTLGYFSPQRPRGGLRCYRQHQLSDDPFLAIGDQDITADVNFDWLLEAGERVGLKLVELSHQGRFLLRHGMPLIRGILEQNAGQLSRERNALHLLTHPQLLGSAFKVLVQQKRG